MSCHLFKLSIFILPSTNGKMKKTVLIFFLHFLFTLIIFSQPSRRNLQPTDIYKIKAVGEGQISPDGKWVAYTVTTIDSAKDRRNTDIWMTSWDGNETIQLTNSPDGESNPKWSPDNKYLSFTSSREGSSNQIYLLNRMGGEAQRLTSVKGELNDYAWSPDATTLLLTMKDAKDTASKMNKPMVINRYQFKQDVEGYRYDTRKTHLYLFTIKDKKLDTLTRGNFDESNARWNPAGTQIAFVSNHSPDPDKNENTDIFIIDAKPGSAEKQMTSWKGYDTNPQWSPDGTKISYHRSSTDDNFIMYDQSILAVLNVKEGTSTLISKSLDRPISFHRWSKDTNSIAVIIADDGIRRLASYNLSTGTLTPIQAGNKVFQSIERHPDGHWLASVSDPVNPTELYTLEKNNLKKITRTNEEFTNQIQFATVEKVSSKSKDGNIVSNLLFTPPGQTKSNLPSVFFIHGGPVAQDEFSFDITRQILAAQGYAVVAVNYRGSSGRGLDYCKSIFADWGNKEVLDIQGAANHLITQKIIDSTRMGIGGWSYGGILTDYTIAKDTRFKSAVSGAGSAMQLSLYGVDQYILQFDNELGQPWKDNNYQKYLKLSYPFLNADKIKTPTLFMTGEKDFNVPAVGSEQMYQALKSIGTPTELIIYPGQFHGITVPSYQVDRLNRYIGWFDKYLKLKS